MIETVSILTVLAALVVVAVISFLIGACKGEIDAERRFYKRKTEEEEKLSTPPGE